MAGVATLTGALLLTTAPTASADYIRDKQWVVDTIDFEKVWKESRGNGVTVAVIDSGVDSSHPDLTGQVLKGRDFSGQGAGAHDDTESHGTAMASLIAGHGHGPGKASGVLGLAPDSKILPVKFSVQVNGQQSNLQLASSIRYAVDAGAEVINLSGGNSGSPEPEIVEAIHYAQQRDVVLVAATGNEGAAVGSPANVPGVVAVGAVDANLDIWDRSNQGKEVTLVAPGVDIVSADPNAESGYRQGTGTSDSAAFVSATAALIRSKYPDLSAGQVVNRLIKSATFAHHEIDKRDSKYGYGIIRPWRALAADIPKGPVEGPLPQAPSGPEGQGAGTPQGDGNDNSQPQTQGSTSVAIPLAVGTLVALAIIGGVVFAIVRSRARRRFAGADAHQAQGPASPTWPN
ncbi:type VII secretion-associated serine protease mycosin [Streptomyces luteolus]|uniref:Type VII secretion-associated serine protease mycosin n=1 Tax=Streptomyces luteolus TaxID=3043615 RepID=A0ABT6SXW4_9ACTN|nr:type VII secretion-associated serine protease mycosin [Streptomyces sp. B-S-A12]MDI3419502.1 type VII secretion-associated serine protease mycosin [Streptomyces sp. B-S-A12]